MAFTEDMSSTSAYSNFGNTLDVSERTLEPGDRVISSTSQAYQVAGTIIYDSREIVRKAAKITAKINGSPPRSRRENKDQAKNWQSNVSTGALSTTIAKIPPRLWQPVKTARYLVANSLPEGTPNGNHKTEYFRRIITTAIRSWRKWPFTVQTLANEVCKYGVGYPTFFDTEEWRPAILRMDRAFVPAGAEIMDDYLGFYTVKWDYAPGELLQLLKNSTEAGLKDWERDNVVNAINNATLVDKSAQLENARSYEDMVRQGTAWLSFVKGVRKVQTLHLFAQEADGKVSHYILLADDEGGAYGMDTQPPPPDKAASGLLYSKLDKFDGIADVTIPMAFEYGNGNIQGSQGAGHILYDMSVQLELSRNESFDNLKMSNRLKLQVPDAKDVNQVKTVVQDTQVIVSGAQFAGVQAALPTNVEGYILLDQQMSRLMEEKVGAFLPAYSAATSSKTATEAEIIAAKEQEIRDAILDNWLTQFALLTHAMMRRLTAKGSSDKTAKKVREDLLEQLDEEEIEILRDSPPNLSIIEFTDIIAQRKAAFAMSVRGNPYYDQFQVEQLIAEAAVGQEVASVILPPGEDQNKIAEATRQQILELSAIDGGAPVPVIMTDSHFVHMNTMKPWMNAKLTAASQSEFQDAPVTAVLTSGLQHYEQHYTFGVEQKTIPKDAINPEKQLIATWKRALDSIIKKQEAGARLQAIQAGQMAVATGGPEQAVRALEATAINPPANDQPPVPGVPA